MVEAMGWSRRSWWRGIMVAAMAMRILAVNMAAGTFGRAAHFRSFEVDMLSPAGHESVRAAERPCAGPLLPSHRRVV